MSRINRRRFVSAVGASGIAGAIAGCLGGDEGDDEVFAIGHLNPLSGEMAPTGQPAENGAELAVDEINENGGIDGREVELYSEDSEADPDTAISRARRMVQEDDVRVIVGVLSSDAALSLSEFAAQEDIILNVSMAMTPDLTGEACRRTTFRTGGDIEHAQLNMSAAVDEHMPDVETIAHIHPNYTFGQQSMEFFTEYMEDLRPDIEWVTELLPEFGQGDYPNEISAIQDADPDAIVTSMWGNDGISFIRQGQEFGLFDDIELIMSSNESLSIAAGVPEEMPEGTVANAHYYFEYPDTEENQAFVDSYMDEFGEFPTGTSQETYSGVYSIKHAAERAGGVSTDDLVDGLEGLEWETPEGTKYIRPEDHFAEQDAWQGRMGPVDAIDDHYGFTEMWPSEVNPEPDPACEMSE